MTVTEVSKQQVTAQTILDIFYYLLSEDNDWEWFLELLQWKDIRNTKYKHIYLFFFTLFIVCIGNN